MKLLNNDDEIVKGKSYPVVCNAKINPKIKLITITPMVFVLVNLKFII